MRAILSLYMLPALRVLMLIWTGFIAFASLAPFNFTIDAATAKAFWVFLDANPFRPRTGRASLLFDASINVILFVPMGVGLWFNEHLSKCAAISLRLWLGLGLLYAVVLQALQLLLPRRTASLSDAVWNAAGLLAGAVAAWLVWKGWQEIRRSRTRPPVT